MSKTQLFSTLLTKELSQNHRRYLLIFCLFLIGILCGTLMVATTTSSTDIQEYVDSFLSSYSLQGVDKSRVFRLSVWNYLRFLFFLWISGWYPWLFPLCFLQVFSKGFRIGLSVTCFIQCYSFRGILLSVLTLLPQNLLFLPALVFFSVYQFQFLSDRRYILAGCGNKSFSKQVYIRNLFCCILFLFVILLCSLIEGYLIPSWLQIFCSFFHS